MSKSDVMLFNMVCNNSPSQGSLHEVWKQLKAQASYIESESSELLEGTALEDMNNVIKEWADVKYTLTYMEQLLQAFGVNTQQAFQEVCDNNKQKYTTSYTYAKESQEHLERKGVDCYIEQTVYEGTTYYTCRSIPMGKVQKLKHYENLDLKHLTPKEFLE